MDEPSGNKQLKCPSCDKTASVVKDSRGTDVGHIRRRRMCLACNHRWSTIEVPLVADVSMYQRGLTAIQLDNALIELEKATYTIRLIREQFPEAWD